MVNLKKIGAVATGALFIGATLGMATAITVPTAFNSNMLAQGGVAKAQLVVGANAPGKTADEESANIIKNAVKSKLAVAGLGGDLNIQYGSSDLDGDDATTTHYFARTNESGWYRATGATANTSSFSTSTNEGYIIHLNKNQTEVMWYDADGNGKLRDSSDYVLYDGLYVVDSTTVRPVLDLANPAIMQSSDSLGGMFTGTAYSAESWQDVSGTGLGWLGGVFKIKGNKYVLTKESSATKAEIASAKIVTLPNKGTSNLKDYATTIFGGKMAWETATGAVLNSNGTLFIMDADGNTEKTISVDVKSATAGDVLVMGTSGMIKDSALSGTSFAGYKVFLANTSAGLKVIVGKSGEFTLNNNMDNAMGYNKLYMYMGAAATQNPDFALLPNNVFMVMGPAVSLVTGDTVDVPDTEYQAKLDITKSLTLKRKRTVAVSSGTKLKDSDPDYGDFLDEDITPTVAGSDINVAYGSSDLDGDDATTNHYFARTNESGWYRATGATANTSSFSTSTNEGYIIHLNKNQTEVMWYDANANGKLRDSADYVLYDGLYVVDSTTVRPVLDLANPAIMQTSDSLGGMFTGTAYSAESWQDVSGTGLGWLGGVFKIKGNKYVLTKESSATKAEIASAKIVTLPNKGTSNLKDYATTIFGGKMAWETATGAVLNSNGTLFIMDADGNTEKTISVDVKSATAGDVLVMGTSGMIKDSALSGTSFAGYKVFLSNTSSGLKVIVGKSGEFTLNNNMDNAMGYDKLYMYMGAAATQNPDFALLPNNVFMVMGPAVSLVTGDTVDVPDTEYQAKLDITKSLTLKRKKTLSVSSGSKLKATDPDYDPFLAEDITFTAGGSGGSVEPVLALVDDTATSSTMNHVYVGGPVAVDKVAALVEAGKSVVDWHNSDGDIEIVNDQPAAGKYGIIVAGKNRAKTKEAAQALADAL